MQSNGIILRLQRNDTSNDTGGTQKHAKWKKADITEYVLGDCIYVKCKSEQNSVMETEIRMVASFEVGKGVASWDWLVGDTGELSREKGVFYILIGMCITCVCAFVKTHWTYALKIWEFHWKL